MEKPHILVIATGGTIASKEGELGLTPAMSGEELVSDIPGIRNVCTLDVIQLMNIDSTNMRPCQWLKIRDAIMEHYNCYDGFVILHGTDTMAYTAAALSYLIQNSKKPIILTGSQKPMGNPYTDAKINLYQSILYAADAKSCNVCIVFNGKVVSGTRGRKQRTRSFDAFESMNFPELAIIRDNRIIRYYTEALPAPEDLITYDRLNDRVFVLKLTPEVKSEIFSLLFDHFSTSNKSKSPFRYARNNIFKPSISSFIFAPLSVLRTINRSFSVSTNSDFDSISLFSVQSRIHTLEWLM